MSSYQISDDSRQLVKATLPLVKKCIVIISAHFHDYLLHEAPDMQYLFSFTREKSSTAGGGAHHGGDDRTDASIDGALAKAIANAMLCFCTHLDAIDQLLQSPNGHALVNNIISKHVAVQVPAAGYPAVGALLLKAIEKTLLDAKMATVEQMPQILSAWGDLYNYLGSIFRDLETEMKNSILAQPGGWSGARLFTLADKKVVQSFTFEEDYRSPTSATTAALRYNNNNNNNNNMPSTTTTTVNQSKTQLPSSSDGGIHGLSYADANRYITTLQEQQQQNQKQQNKKTSNSNPHLESTSTWLHLTLRSADGLPVYAPTPGAFLTIRFRDENKGIDTLRHFSISNFVKTGQDYYQIAVNVIPGGLISNYLLNDCEIGKVFEVNPPVGSFHLQTALTETFFSRVDDLIVQNGFTQYFPALPTAHIARRQEQAQANHCGGNDNNNILNNNVNNNPELVKASSTHTTTSAQSLTPQQSFSNNTRSGTGMGISIDGDNDENNSNCTLTTQNPPLSHFTQNTTNNSNNNITNTDSNITEPDVNSLVPSMSSLNNNNDNINSTSKLSNINTPQQPSQQPPTIINLTNHTPATPQSNSTMNRHMLLSSTPTSGSHNNINQQQLQQQNNQKKRSNGGVNKNMIYATPDTILPPQEIIEQLGLVIKRVKQLPPAPIPIILNTNTDANTNNKKEIQEGSSCSNNSSNNNQQQQPHCYSLTKPTTTRTSASFSNVNEHHDDGLDTVSRHSSTSCSNVSNASTNQQQQQQIAMAEGSSSNNNNNTNTTTTTFRNRPIARISGSKLSTTPSVNTGSVIKVLFLAYNSSIAPFSAMLQQIVDYEKKLEILNLHNIQHNLPRFNVTVLHFVREMHHWTLSKEMLHLNKKYDFFTYVPIFYKKHALIQFSAPSDFFVKLLRYYAQGLTGADIYITGPHQFLKDTHFVLSKELHIDLADATFEFLGPRFQLSEKNEAI